MSRIKALRLVTNANLDAYEARLALITRWEIAVGTGNELERKRVEALISDHDQRHGTRLNTPAAA
jgi:hypothetical protein